MTALVALLAVSTWPGAWGAENLRARADRLCQSGEDLEAARCYRETADYYRQQGDEQAALIMESKADQCEPILRGYVDRKATSADLQRYYTGAKGEPVYGCYLGTNCGLDANVDGDFDDFCAKVGKQHALVYGYGSYGHTDSNLLALSAENGPWVQVACELPQGLRAVTAGPLLDNWARELAEVGQPVFLRWGSEMNGDWVPWHGDPQLYIAKWRLVYNTMKRLAPNVITVWCPNDVPRASIEAYYPGDAYVDWVGVNFYVVTIHDNDLGRDARAENPADHLKWIYHTYADRKPLMICETGVTHEGEAVGREEVAFAVARLRQLYGSLPRLYPRVKAICYYDVNNLGGAATGRAFNNYLLTDRTEITAAYRAVIAPDYFLGQPGAEGEPVSTYVAPLADGMTVRGRQHLSAWAQARCLTPTVDYLLDGRRIGSSSVAGSYDLDFDFGSVPAGPHRLTLVMLSPADGKKLLEVEYSLRVEAPGAS